MFHTQKNNQIKEEYNDMSFELELAMIRERQALETSFAAPHSSQPEAASLRFDGEASINFAPSSVVRALDDEYDSKLQFSSPHSNASRATIYSSATIPSTDTIDWDSIRQQVPTQHRGTHGNPHHESTASLKSVPADAFLPTPAASAPTPQPQWTPVAINLNLYNPARTFFRIREIIECKAALSQRQPHAVYNLFARVLYSSRENLLRRQHFQLRDLLSDSPPYLSGALLG
jgi:hypothetical protein